MTNVSGGNQTSKRTATFGILVALAFLFSYLETLIPFSFGVPGIKLGLANLVTVIALYAMGERQAFAISLVRVFLYGFTFGNLSVMLYSLAGGLLSFACMRASKRFTGLGVAGVSVIGGVAHNLGQLLMAALVLRTKSLMYYFPILLAAGTVAGLLIGLLSAMVLKRLLPFFARGT